jgi:hypothetical protein
VLESFSFSVSQEDKKSIEERFKASKCVEALKAKMSKAEFFALCTTATAFATPKEARSFFKTEVGETHKGLVSKEDLQAILSAAEELASPLTSNIQANIDIKV